MVRTPFKPTNTPSKRDEPSEQLPQKRQRSEAAPDRDPSASAQGSGLPPLSPSVPTPSKNQANWNCAVCTLLNERAGSDKCDACGSPRPQQRQLGTAEAPILCESDSENGLSPQRVSRAMVVASNEKLAEASQTKELLRPPAMLQLEELNPPQDAAVDGRASDEGVFLTPAPATQASEPNGTPILQRTEEREEQQEQEEQQNVAAEQNRAGSDKKENDDDSDDPVKEKNPHPPEIQALHERAKKILDIERDPETVAPVLSVEEAAVNNSGEPPRSSATAARVTQPELRAASAVGQENEGRVWGWDDDEWLIEQAESFVRDFAPLQAYRNATGGPANKDKLCRPCFGLRQAQQKLRRSPASLQARLRKHLRDGVIQVMPPLGLWWVPCRRRQNHRVAALEQRMLGLSDEQARTLELIVYYGENVFLSGAAGTGKSHTLQMAIEALRMLRPRNSRTVCVTASTGIAATNVGGDTLHHFSGITPDLEQGAFRTGSMDWAADKIRFNKRKRTNWMMCSVLVVDEISMVSGEFLKLVDHVGKQTRQNDQPFGGVQVVLCGDFLQLPPVPNKDRPAPYQGHADYAFLSAAWKSANFRHCVLMKPFRQRDNDFLQLLNDIRVGSVRHESVDMLKSLSRPVDVGDLRRDFVDNQRAHVRRRISAGAPVAPAKQEGETGNDDVEEDRAAEALSNLVTLCGTNAMVEDMNRVAFERLDGTIHTYKSKDYTIEPHLKITANDFLAQEVLKLRVGAKVILIRNLRLDGIGLISNGTCGDVVDFVDPEQTGFGDVQPLTFSLGRKKLPVVNFVVTNVHGNTRKMRVIVQPEKFEMNDALTQETIKSRIQIPLKPAWALTVHKSQGLSIAAIDVECTSLFEKQQAYVALSRCKTLEGLQLMNFGTPCIKTCRVAVDFYHRIASNATAALWEDKKLPAFDAEELWYGSDEESGIEDDDGGEPGSPDGSGLGGQSTESILRQWSHGEETLGRPSVGDVFPGHGELRDARRAIDDNHGQRTGWRQAQRSGTGGEWRRPDQSPQQGRGGGSRSARAPRAPRAPRDRSRQRGSPQGRSNGNSGQKPSDMMAQFFNLNNNKKK